ncbi:hypothetical protein SLS54_007700 [Diplodia seriata]|nr:hypothetical protein BK809_0005737 [Diplodia seriata]
MAFFDAFFEASHPKQVYSQLPESEDSNEQPPPTEKPADQPSGSKHRFLCYLAVAWFSILLFLPVIHYTRHVDVHVLTNTWDPHVGEDEADGEAFGPIFGSQEDASKFYYPPIGTNFHPQVAPFNHPPAERPRTPLFIPFTRNNNMLRQAVLGWIAAGWPRSDIIIVDNTGTMDANPRGQLSRENPFFIDYDLYRARYGVSIMQASTLLNFAQLQNLLLRLAIAEGWPYFFWSHMDIGVLSDEVTVPYKSFYSRALDVLDDATLPHPSYPNITWSASPREMRNTTGAWAIKFFEFDNLALINVAAWRRIGSWDTFVPYYNTDCDAYARILFHGYTKDSVSAGRIFDVADQAVAARDDPTGEKLETLFFPRASLALKNASAADAQLERYRIELAAKENPNMTTTAEYLDLPEPNLLDDPDNSPNSPRYQALVRTFQDLQDRKYASGRNTWQDVQKGGKGEPWTYDPRGFQKAWWETAGYGRDLYTKKWGTLDCTLGGVKLEDEWKSEYPPTPLQEDVAVEPVVGKRGVRGDDKATMNKRWVQRASSGEWYLG